MRFAKLSGCIGLLMVAGMLIAADKAAEKKCLCPVSGEAISKEASMDYKGGKLYFCCNGCKAKFDGDTAKYAAKANEQLVATGQAKQVACPFTGKACNAATATSVDGVKVCFCCNGCKGKVAKADKAQQVEMVFGDSVFDKGFKVTAAK